MPEIREWGRPLAEILAPKQRSAEETFELHYIFRPLMLWREHPVLALPVISGIFIPPHERIMLDVAHIGSLTNVFVGSRGTSKTTTIDLLYQTYNALFWKHRDGVILSAVGFRGGQFLFTDLERWANGAWVDQEAGLRFVYRAAVRENLIHRAPNFWKIDYDSFSSALTVPTNDPEKLRGIRGTDLYLDEANFMEMELVDKVAESFLNVLRDMRTGGENAIPNRVFYTTTVDYAWRDFQKTARSAYEGCRRDYDAYRASKKKDWEAYSVLEAAGLCQHSFACFDYTDTIIRRFVKTRDGRRMEVTWPDKIRRWTRDPHGVPFTERDAEGRMLAPGKPTEIIPTYGINRVKMEQKILSGDTPEEVWLAEQRNVVDSSAGDVYSHAIVDNSVCKGNKFILPWSECGAAYHKRYKDIERHFVPPVMWSSTDPCVLGVDYAPGNRDFCAFIVIRMGPLATGVFDPVTGEGKTEWSNVIWCEQHRNASGENVAEKIRAFADRYNLTYFHDPYETDHWKLCRAVGLDVRGGGNAVRDALVFVNKETLSTEEYRILDPLDDDERLAAFKTEANSKPMLDAIKPTGQLNDKLVEFTVAQLQQKLLFIPADVPMSERPLDRKYDIAYDGARNLEHQLRALQQTPTASGYRKFFMKGDEETSSNKKDFWAAFIYASKQLRAHLLRQRLINDVPVATGACITNFGIGRRNVYGNSATRLWR
jgi:hypothetical protein